MFCLSLFSVLFYTLYHSIIIVLLSTVLFKLPLSLLYHVVVVVDLHHSCV